MDRRALAIEARRNGIPERQLTSWLLMLSPTAAFEGREEIGFSITSQVADFFSVSVRAVHVCGSAKLGFSPQKCQPFEEGLSDLDIAIIDEKCFMRFVGLVLEETDQYRNLTKFTRDSNGNHSYAGFAKYLAKGIFRPDMMPHGAARKRWFDFFNSLSAVYKSTFSGVSAGIYLSDDAFNMRQVRTVSSIWSEGGAI